MGDWLSSSSIGTQLFLVVGGRLFLDAVWCLHCLEWDPFWWVSYYGYLIREVVAVMLPKRCGAEVPSEVTLFARAVLKNGLNA